MKIHARAGEKITIIEKRTGLDRYGREPRPVLVRVEKVGRKYITGVVNWFDSQENGVVERNYYSTKFDMTEYKIISHTFDVNLVKKYNKYEIARREYENRERNAIRDIDWEERSKYLDARDQRISEWREANPRPVFTVEG